MTLTRDRIRDGYVQRMVAASGLMRVLSEEELAASRRAVLAAVEPGADVWIFGYGSLMWNPAFHYVEQCTGQLHGYHRRFCLWTHLGRGDQTNPGLLLGLDQGGSCRGVLFRVAAGAVESETEIIWRREMVSGAYMPRWLSVRTVEGLVRAIAFVINRSHERYAGLLPEQEVVRRISRAAGELGTCADYLINTVAHLDELGICDRTLRSLRDRVLKTSVAPEGIR